ncbi:hypothetical protein [Actinoplanes auranticolor]|uniref:WD40 repeat protein n=1 Tax=Actinoplanes auranticolor TaxID=47988 RepID=A0A919SY10_9ACTN|nr:hypothetical protein [Actinoplanes auranticolor]GIM80114.1 hypothetical protein Aau02nite_89040 [Actinoplanes auranticolor]
MTGEQTQGQNENQKLRRYIVSAVAVVLLAVVAAVVTIIALRGGSEPPDKIDAAAFADQMSAEADRVRHTDPQRSLRLRIAAEQLDPHQRRRAALAHALVTPQPVSSVKAGEGYISTMALAPDGRTVLVGGTRTELWNIADPATPVKVSSLPAAVGEVSGAVFVDDGALVLAAEKTLTYWDVRNPAKPRRIATMFEGPERLGPVAATADGDRAVVVSGQSAVVLDIRRPDAAAKLATLPARKASTASRSARTGGPSTSGTGDWRTPR